jgi:hypothetical protein
MGVVLSSLTLSFPSLNIQCVRYFILRRENMFSTLTSEDKKNHSLRSSLKRKVYNAFFEDTLNVRSISSWKRNVLATLFFENKCVRYPIILG